MKGCNPTDEGEDKTTRIFPRTAFNNCNTQAKGDFRQFRAIFCGSELLGLHGKTQAVHNISSTDILYATAVTRTSSTVSMSSTWIASSD